MEHSTPSPPDENTSRRKAAVPWLEVVALLLVLGMNVLLALVFCFPPAAASAG